MKDKVVKLMNNIINFLKMLKDKIFTFIIANKKLSIIALAIVVIIILCICLISRKTEMGNTSGNLSNSGFSVEKDGWIYYLGFKDSNSDGIYKVKSNSNKKEKISSDYGLYLNKSGKYLYYLDRTLGNYNIAKIKDNGKDKETIIENVDAGKITVIDNWIYYFKDSKFYKSKTNGKSKQILSNKIIYDYEVVGNWIYYSYINNGKYIISKMKRNGEDIKKIDEDGARAFFIKDNRIYYIYENYDENEYKYSYEMYSIKTNGKDKDKITTIEGNVKLDTLNFDGNRFYYVKTDDDNKTSIYSIKINGKDETNIVDIQGYSTILNINSGKIYYTDQEDNGDSQMYRIKTNGKDKESLSL